MWLDWNVADPATRAAAVADIRDMVDGVGVTYLRVVAAALDGDTVDHDALAGRVLPPRGSSCWSATAGWPMPPAVEAAVRALPPGGDGFLADLERPPPTGRSRSWSARLAYLTRRWDLPVDRDALGR